MSGLRAPARCSTVLSGTNAANEGSRLKLNVVRRNRAGHQRLADRYPAVRQQYEGPAHEWRVRRIISMDIGGVVIPQKCDGYHIGGCGISLGFPPPTGD